MSKLSYEDKINIYNNKKEGISIKALSKKYDVRDNVIKYLIRVIEIINRVLIDGESIFSVAVDEYITTNNIMI